MGTGFIGFLLIEKLHQIGYFYKRDISGNF